MPGFTKPAKPIILLLTHNFFTFPAWLPFDAEAMQYANDMFTPNQIKTRCGYPTLDAMRQAWKALYGDEIPFPASNEPIPSDRAEEFLTRLATPYQNKRQQTIDGANAMLSAIQSGSELADFEPTPVAGEIKVRRPRKNTDVKARRSAQFKSVDMNISGQSVPVAVLKPSMFFSILDRINKGVEYLMNMTILEWAYYTGISITIAAVVDLLGWVGVLYSVLYFLVSRKVMLMTKSRKTRESAGWGIVMIIGMELVAWFIHFPMFNNIVWSKSGALPWHNIVKIKDAEVPGLLIQTDTIPGTYAFFLSTFMCIICIYAPWQTLILTNETVRQEDHQRDFGKEY